jgi:DNA-binding protein H-NS
MSYATQQSKLEKEINRLQKRAAALQALQRRPVLTRIVKDMQIHGITIEALQTALHRGSRNRDNVPATGIQARVRRAIAPKYRDPHSGETWAGRGRTPRWIIAAELAGGSREQFLIQ